MRMDHQQESFVNTGKYSYHDIFSVLPLTSLRLSVDNITVALDGFSRFVLAYNGTVPGPALIADWGDTFVVHVTNNMAENGTTVHWHSIRQLENSQYDGVPGVTQW